MFSSAKSEGVEPSTSYLLVSIFGDPDQLSAFRHGLEPLLRSQRIALKSEPWLYRGNMAFYLIHVPNLEALQELSSLHTLVKNMTYESDHPDLSLNAGTAACEKALTPH